MSINKIEYTVTKTDIIPKIEQNGGQQGDDGITDIIFTVEEGLFNELQSFSGDILYRVQTIDGAGVLHTSMPLEISSERKIVYPLKREITIRGGTAFAHLVIYNNGNGNEKEMYSFAARIRFRDTAGIGDERQFSERLSEMLSDIDKYIGDEITQRSSATPIEGNVALYSVGGTLKVGTPQDENDSVPLSKLNTELKKKVDKVTGKGLSTNDYTNNEKNKLSGIESGAQKNVPADLEYNPDSDNSQSGKAVAEALNNINIDVSSLGANALKGNKNGTTIVCDDVSPIEHNVKLTVPYFNNLITELQIGEFIDKNFTLSDTESTTKRCFRVDGEGDNFELTCNIPLIVKSLVFTNQFVQGVDIPTPWTPTSIGLPIGVNLQRADGLAWTGEEKVIFRKAIYNGNVVEPIVYKYGKNLLPKLFTSPIITNGITYTMNMDGSVTVNGTATATASIRKTTISLEAGSYAMTLGTGNVSFVGSYEKDGSTKYISNKFTLDAPTEVEFYLQVNPDKTVDNVTIYPQVEFGTVQTEYEPYIEPIEYTEIDENGEVVGITSLYPSMTFTNNVSEEMSCEYNRDINKAIQSLEQAIATLSNT